MQPSWRGLGPQWSKDGALKGRIRKRRAEMERRGLRMAPEIVRKRRLCHLPSIRLVVLFLILIVIFFL